MIGKSFERQRTHTLLGLVLALTLAAHADTVNTSDYDDYLTTTDQSGKSSFSTAGNWNSKTAPTAGKTYVVTVPDTQSSSRDIRGEETADTTFAGDRLALHNARYISKSGKNITIPELDMIYGWIWNGQGGSTQNLYGHINVLNTNNNHEVAIVGSGNSGNRTWKIYSEIRGEEGSTLTLRHSNEADSGSAAFSCYLYGTNTAFKGKMVIDGGAHGATSIGTEPVQVHISDLRNLGAGNLAPKGTEVVLQDGGTLLLDAALAWTNGYTIVATNTEGNTSVSSIKLQTSGEVSGIAFGNEGAVFGEGVKMKGGHLKFRHYGTTPRLCLADIDATELDYLEDGTEAVRLYAEVATNAEGRLISAKGLNLGGSLKLLNSVDRIYLYAVPKLWSETMLPVVSVGGFDRTDDIDELTVFKNIKIGYSSNGTGKDVSQPYAFITRADDGRYAVALLPEVVQHTGTDGSGASSYDSYAGKTNVAVNANKLLRAPKGTTSVFPAANLYLQKGSELALCDGATTVTNLYALSGGECLARGTGSLNELCGRMVVLARPDEPFLVSITTTSKGSGGRTLTLSANQEGYGAVNYGFRKEDIAWSEETPLSKIVVSGDNRQYKGPISISDKATRVIFTDQNALGAASSLTVRGGATLAVTRSLVFTNDFTVGASGTVATNCYGAVVEVDTNKTLTVSGTVTFDGGTNTLTKTGAGTLVFTGSFVTNSVWAVNDGEVVIPTNAIYTLTSGCSYTNDMIHLCAGTTVPTLVAPDGNQNVDAASTNAALAKVGINLTSDQLTQGLKASYFKKAVTNTVVNTTTGKTTYSVAIKLNDDPTDYNNVTPTAGTMTLPTTGGVSLSPGNVKKGLYYSLDAFTDSACSQSSTAGAVQQAGDTPLTLSNGSLPGSGETVKYYKIRVSDTNASSGN